MNCRQFARHVAASVELLDGGWAARFQFWLHWLICPFCKRYWKELRALGAVHRRQSAFARHPGVRFHELKLRLKEKLRRDFA